MIDVCIAEIGTEKVIKRFECSGLREAQKMGRALSSKIDHERFYTKFIIKTDKDRTHTMLKIEPGKFYRTRDGRKVGPIEEFAPYQDKQFVRAGSNDQTGFESYRLDGTWDFYPGQLTKNDLISEWQDEEPTGPVRTVTVTKKIIQTGVYGKVTVGDAGDRKLIYVQIGNGSAFLSAQELRDAAKVLNELAECLEENASCASATK